VANEKEFQQKIRQLGSLVGELDQIPGGGSRVAARELVQLLMEVHGTALERIMELVFESGAGGGAMIDKLAQDQIVGNLLLLYSLHPDDLETRVAKALDEVRPRLRKFDCSVERVEVRDGVVELQMKLANPAHGSHGRNVRPIVEEAIYNMAPDLTSLTILGLDEGASGFVPLESLLQRPAPQILVAPGLEGD
jgi:hypothetical protein